MDGNSGHKLVQQAAVMGRSSTHVADDLAAALFPGSDIYISDRILSNSRQYLRSLVKDIESEICMVAVEKLGVANDIIVEIGGSETSHSYALLEKSGLLGETKLLDHIFIMAQRRELYARVLQKISQSELETVLTRYLDNEDAGIADAAMALLVAQSREGGDNIRGSMDTVPADILYAFIWPITAAIGQLSGYIGTKLVAAAETLLGQHDESVSIHSRAQRLAHLVEQSGQAHDEFLYPLRDGVDLFVARLAKRAGLSNDQIILFTAEPGMPRLTITLRALDMPSEEACAIFAALDSGSQILTPASYKEIDQQQAIDLVRQWGVNSAYSEARLKLSSASTEPSG